MSKIFEETVLKALDSLQSDVGGLKADVGELKQDVGGLKADVGGLKQDVQRLEVLHEETAEKIDQIIEVVSPEIQRTNEHEQRITKLEQSAA